MIIRNINRDYFTDEGHLNEEYIALYVDALILSKVDNLPLPVLEHVEDCMQCKTGIIDLYEILKDHKEIKNRKHPYFDRISWESSRQFMKLAAIFLGLIVISAVFYYLFYYQRGYQQLFAENFKPYDDVITERGMMTTECDTMLNMLITEYYNSGRYDSAEILFSKLYSSDKSNDSLLFYYGNTCLATGNYAKAIQLLKELSFIKKSIFYHQSRWYLALSYLNAAANLKGEERQDMLSNSEMILQELIDNNSSYAEKARKLLSKY